MRHHSPLTILLFVTCLAICATLSPCFAQITFERTYDGGSAWGFSVQQTSDGGYIIAGYGDTTMGLDTDVYLIRTDSLGDLLWLKSYDLTAYDYGSSVQQTQDGGFIIAGYVDSFHTERQDAILLRTDSQGDVLWEETYDYVARDEFWCVQQTQDRGYIAAGRTSSFGAGGLDAYLLKTDSLGNAVWEKTYGDSLDEGFFSVVQTLGGGYAMAGYAESHGTGDLQMYLVKTDSLGNSMWEATYGGSSDEWGYEVVQTSDSGFVTSGMTASYGAGDWDFYLVRLDGSGGVLWEETYGDTSADWGRSVQITSDGGYILTGSTNSFGAGQFDVYLVRTDSVGDTVWTRTYGGVSQDLSWQVRLTDDGGFVIVGWTASFGPWWDVYLIKTDENGLTGVNEGYLASGSRRSFRLLQNHPNPFHHSTLISYSLPSGTQVTLSIYDISGRLVETLVNETQQPGVHQVRWNRKSNPSGVYFCQLEAGEFVETRKMVVVE